MTSRRHRLSLSAIAILIAIGTVSPLRTETAAATTPTLQDLQGVAEVKTLFNQDAGVVRLVMLVSPT